MRIFAVKIKIKNCSFRHVLQIKHFLNVNFLFHFGASKVGGTQSTAVSFVASCQASLGMACKRTVAENLTET